MLPLICLADEHEHAKRASEQQAHEKAKQRKTLARKREQVSKAAEMDPFMALTLKVPSRGPAASPVNTDPDNVVCTTLAVDMLLTPA